MENAANKENMPDGVETIEDLVKHSLAKDYNKANQTFGNLMTVRMDDMLNQEKVKIADQIYNHLDQENGGDGDDPETEEPEEEMENENEVEETESEEHTHDDGTTHSHPGGDEEHTHDGDDEDDEEENDVEGAAV